MYRVLVLMPLAAGLVGCRPEQQPDRPGSEPIVVFAAASTGDAMDEIKARFEHKHGAAVLTNYAATSALVQQITSHAEADVFLSANTLWTDYLDDRGLLASRRDLLSNSLVIVVPLDSNISLERPEDLLSEKIRHIALADPEAAPAGMYAKQALENMGLWAKLEGKIAPAADVRRALSFVETQAAEAGLVYGTDAAGSQSVRVAVELDPKLTDPIRYPVALLMSASDKPAARQLYDYLTSAEAADVFSDHGFGVVFEPSERRTRGDTPGMDFAAFAFLTPQEWSAFRLSCQVAACAALVGLPFAVAVGYVLARNPFSGKWLVEAVVNLPLVLPPVVTGYLLLVLLAPGGPVGSVLDNWLGIKIVFHWTGAALAAMVVSFPLMVRAIRLSFQGVDPGLEMAARSLGASRTVAFFTVTLPLARRGLIAGWLLAFARSLGEFGATIMFVGNIEGKTQTIPLAIFQISSRPGGIERCWRLVGLSIVLACAALAVSELMERRETRHESA